jgi:IS5 family transposase
LELNSKNILFILILSLSSCGLKRYPKAKDKTSRPEVTDQYKFKYKKKIPLDKKEKKKPEEKDSEQI